MKKTKLTRSLMTAVSVVALSAVMYGCVHSSDDPPPADPPPVDTDGDGVPDDKDAFPKDPKETKDTDGDGVGDNADVFPNDKSESKDSDGDGIGDNADPFPNVPNDRDNDGVPDAGDDFPDDPNESRDSDGDGVGDKADAFPLDPNESKDSDGDGTGDKADAFPDDKNESKDSDGDGVGDNGDAFPDDKNESKDSDGDGVGDNGDAFPDDAKEWADSDMDGTGDNSDDFPDDPSETRDSDRDGTGDNADAFPFDPNETDDSDGDGHGDNADAFPDDPAEWADSDGDGTGDNADEFPDDPSETADSDMDGVGDEADAFPNDPAEWADSDGDGYGDNAADAFPDDPMEWADSDGDGVGDNADDFPNDPNETNRAAAEAKLWLGALKDGKRLDANSTTAGNQLPFTIDGGKLTTTEPPGKKNDFMASPGDAGTFKNNGSWDWVNYTRNITGGSDWVVNYTDKAANGDAEYTTYFAQGATVSGLDSGSAPASTTGQINLAEADLGTDADLHEQFTGDFGITAPNQVIPGTTNDPNTVTVDESINQVTGSFYGVPGTFQCTFSGGTDCERRSDKDGNLSGLGGQWTFTPTRATGVTVADLMVLGVVPDTDYMDIGYWIEYAEDKDGDQTRGILAYAEGERDFGDVSSLEGTATYVGPALGRYMGVSFDSASGAMSAVVSGHFDATAELTARFGGNAVAADDAFSIDGTISEFSAFVDDNYAEFPGMDHWVLRLNRGGTNNTANNITQSDGSITGTTVGMSGTLAGAAGTWAGMFHGPNGTDATDRPVSVSGTFDGHFSNGHVVGAFGANLDDD